MWIGKCGLATVGCTILTLQLVVKYSILVQRSVIDMHAGTVQKDTVLCKKSFHQVHEYLRTIRDTLRAVREYMLCVAVNGYKRCLLEYHE